MDTTQNTTVPGQSDPSQSAPAPTSAPATASAPAPAPNTSSAIAGGLAQAFVNAGNAATQPPTTAADQNLPLQHYTRPTPGDTFNQIASPAGGKPSLARTILAGALVGMIHGLGAKPGPGSMGQAAELGFQGEQEFEDRQRAIAQQQKDQAAKDQYQQNLQKAQGLDLNLKQLQLQKQQSDMDEQTHQKTVDLYAPQLADAIESNPDAVKGQHIPEREAADVTKYGSHPLRIPDGYVPKPGGGFEQTFTVLDGDTKVRVGDLAAQAQAWHIPGADKLSPEDSVSLLTTGPYTHAVATLEATQAELNDEAKALGTTPVDLKAKMAENPGFLNAVRQFQRSSWASTHPDEQISAMRQDKNAAPYAPYMEQLFGGRQALNNMATLRNMDDKTAAQIAHAPEGQYSPALVTAANERMSKAKSEDKYPQDAISASVGGTPHKDEKGNWTWNGKTYSSEAEAGKDFGQAYERQKVAENVNQHNEEHPQSASWVAGVTADEKKKAELAENIAFNGNEINNLLARRPDLVGAVAGRYTSAQQMIGNNDKDISALGTLIHNMAMANSGVHGMRSQEGVKETETNLLNNFKNGPNAVAGAVSANVASVQTFIDDARPESYHTHSKQGGAAEYWKKQAASNAGNAKGAAAKIHQNMSDFAHQFTGKNGTIYSDDGKTWYDQNGNLVGGK
jgi:hypothetical protein